MRDLSLGVVAWKWYAVLPISVGIAGNRARPTAFVLEADEEPWELRLGSWKSPVIFFTLPRQGVDNHLKLNEMGGNVLSVASSGQENLKSAKGPTLSASYREWACVEKRPNLPNGGLRLPSKEDGLSQFDPPRTFSTCKAVTLGNALDGRRPDS